MFLHLSAWVPFIRNKDLKSLALQAMSVYDHVYETILSSVITFLCVMRFEIGMNKDVVGIIGRKVFETRSSPSKYGWFNKAHLYKAKDVSNTAAGDFSFDFKVDLNNV